MPKICYKPRKFRDARLAIIDTANALLEEYAAQGIDLTLRSLYYKFIARDLFPETWIDEKYNQKHGLPPGTTNTTKNYKRLGDIVDKGRLAGLIDWNHIEDRVRNLQSRGCWSDPSDMVRSAARSYHLDRWANQDCRIEVFCEKDALSGVFAGVCHKWDLPYFSCRGYVSQSEMWNASLRLGRYAMDAQQPIILHFGDHDPSGIDMTRDIGARLVMFRQAPEMKRLALNMDQVEEFNPPANPAKTTDARFQTYAMTFGEESWELDALEPNVLIALVEEQVQKYRDPDKWREVVEQEQEGKAQLQVLSNHWPDVTDHLDEEFGEDLSEARSELEDEDEYLDELETPKKAKRSKKKGK